MGLLKPCILFVDIMKTCMWSFGGNKINFERNTAFKLTNCLAAFTLWDRHLVKSTSSSVYNGSFLNKAYILWT